MTPGSWIWKALACLLCALLPAMASPRDLPPLDAVGQPLLLAESAQAWIDTSAGTRPQDIDSDTTIRWEPMRPGAVYPLGNGHSLWVRFTLPPIPNGQRWYLDIPAPSLDRATLYTPNDAGGWSSQSAGDRLAVADWPVPHRNPLLPLAAPPGRAATYLLRVENARFFAAPLRLIDESHFSQHEQRTSLALGMYFGLAVLAAAVALLSALSLRDSAYGATALAVATMGLTHASFSGIAGLHLWPHLPWWSDVASTVLPILATGSTALCCLSIVSMPQRSRKLHRSLRALSLACVPAAALAAIVDPTDRYRVLVAYVLLTAATVVFAIGWTARRGDRHALWLLLASVPALLGGAFPLARTLGWLPLGFWTTFGMQLGTGVQWAMLLVILVRRSQQRREQRRRVQGIDRIDPATGLVNRYEFTQRLQRMTKRSQRLRYQSAVLVIDIVNMERLREDFGRRSADEMPVQAAGRLLASMRDIDTVARLSDLRFGVLVEGPLTPEEAAAIAPRIIAQCLMPFDRKPIQWVAHTHVGVAIVPLDGTGAQAVVEQLESVLNATPLDSKQRVFPCKARAGGWPAGHLHQAHAA